LIQYSSNDREAQKCDHIINEYNQNLTPI